MKKIIATLFLNLVIALIAVNSLLAQAPVPIKMGPNLPSTCAVSAKRTVLFYKTGASNGLYYCSAANTWTGPVSAGSGSLVTGSTDNAVLRADGTGGATSQSSLVTIDDSGAVTIPDTQSLKVGGSRVITHNNGTGSMEVNPDARTGLILTAGSYVRNQIATTMITAAISTGFNTFSTGQFGFVSGADVTVAPDTGLARFSAGVAKFTDGSTGIKSLVGGGASVASASALPLPTGRVFHVTGTTTITSITATNLQSGVVITLIFDGILTFTDGSNLKLAGNFVTTADDTITLVFDGTNFYEVARAVN